MVDGDSLSIGDISSAVSMICDGASSHASQDYEENTRISMKPKDRHYEKEGKRWVRRRENSRFVGNGYIVKPSTKDFALSLSLPRSTFPKPLPPFIPRHLSAPSALLPHRDPASANAGRYSLSLTGVRRELRRSGPGAEQIVLDVEQELMEWLETGGILISPDSQHVHPPSATPGVPLGSSQSIIEVHRSPTELIWRIDKDFPRFLLHCVARFHGVVSFSKTAQGIERDVRLTHLLRPNVTRPDFTAPNVLDTPPASEIDAFSVMADTEDSDVTSEFALGSEEGGFTYSNLDSSDAKLNEGLESRVPNPERQQLDDAESSGEHDDDTLSIAFVDSLEESQDWESTPIRRRAQAVPSLSYSPSRSVPRASRLSNPPQLAKIHLPFWRYVFA